MTTKGTSTVLKLDRNLQMTQKCNQGAYDPIQVIAGLHGGIGKALGGTTLQCSVVLPGKHRW